jgi:hypothetical protein
MKILIAGFGKSGTTGLYSLVKNSLPGNPLCSFEPALGDLTGDEVLVKSLVGAWQSSQRLTLHMRPEKHLYKFGAFGQFDKRLFIVRDPRDRIVSGLLYEAATSRFKSRKELNEWLELLAKKEADPNSVSLRELRPSVGTTPKLFGHLQIDCCTDYDHCLVKYEDFVKGRLANVEEYLGFELSGTDDVGPSLSRVVRSKRAGNWRNWMTPDDVEILKPLFTTFMEHFGYDNDDWELNDEPVIEPVLSSGYVRRVWEKEWCRKNLDGTGV